MELNGFYSNTSKVRFLDKIIADLGTCDSFDFSVSFIKVAGLKLLSQAIHDALERGAKGRLITSTYQNFTDIPSLELFLSLKNEFPDRFDCHLDFNCFDDDGFHTKGYIFHFTNHSEIVVGSSNITYFALIKNKEWDVSVISDRTDSTYHDIMNEYEYLWKCTYPLDAKVIREYQSALQYAIVSWDMDGFDPNRMKNIRPNAMQVQALKEIKRCRDLGQDRALVVAATGSGKTYLSAFDVLSMNPKKLLYVVHKDVILHDAMKTYARVFGSSRKYGLYTGAEKDVDWDFLFASNAMLSKHLELFDPEEFDYIVIDEVHHAAASTYQKIINHFYPKFLLGLTATPDRMDGQNIYSMFGNNVPYDLRLRDALENNLVVPFHYYGIKDCMVSYEDETSIESVRRYIQQLASEIHCEFVKEQVEKYRVKGTKLKCVGFCRNKEHARLMAQSMAQQGYQTNYLTGESSMGERIRVLGELQDDGNPLEMVFAVDILNEGIDVPGINMVLFLRPTESSTIFIQQLGRGLRKYQNKEYLVVLDFIANSYKRSLQIAVALSSLSKSGTADKRTMRDYLKTSFKTLGLEGVEIQFDKESVDEILKSIDSTNLNRFDFIKQDYLNFKSALKLGPDQYPMPTDFLNEEIPVDLLRFMNKGTFTSYYDFLLKVQEGIPTFTTEETLFIRAISWYLPLIRGEEFYIIRSLLTGPKTREELIQGCQEDIHFLEASFDHALGMLQNKFVMNQTKDFSRDVIVFEEGKYRLKVSLSNTEFVAWIEDLIEYGIRRYEAEFYGCNDLLKVYGVYSIPKAFMAINSSNLFIMKGVNFVNNRLMILVNLNKDAQKDEKLKYKDKFLSNKVLQWSSDNGCTLDNNKGKTLIGRKEAYVFVRKVKHEDGMDQPFVYLGKGELTNPVDSDPSQTDMKLKTILFDIVLENEVPSVHWYDFGIEDTDE